MKENNKMKKQKVSISDFFMFLSVAFYTCCIFPIELIFIKRKLMKTNEEFRKAYLKKLTN
jgi:hypothetical protein